MTDPYDHMREAFHITADGLMNWQEPPSEPEVTLEFMPDFESGAIHAARDAESRSNALEASYRDTDIETLEKAAESLSRAGDFTNAVALWALALRVRHGG